MPGYRGEGPEREGTRCEPVTPWSYPSEQRQRREDVALPDSARDLLRVGHDCRFEVEDPRRVSHEVVRRPAGLPAVTRTSGSATVTTVSSQPMPSNTSIISVPWLRMPTISSIRERHR